MTSARMEYREEKILLRPDVGLWSQAKADEKGRMEPKRAEFCERIDSAVARFRLVRPICLSGEDEAGARSTVGRPPTPGWNGLTQSVGSLGHF